MGMAMAATLCKLNPSSSSVMQLNSQTPQIITRYQQLLFFFLSLFSLFIVDFVYYPQVKINN